MVRWFWATAWAGYFGGANSTQVKASLDEMRDFARGQGKLRVEGLLARPFPDRFDLRSARVRAYLIWELSTFRERLDLNGDPIDALRYLAESDNKAYRQIVARGTEMASPANRLMFPTRYGQSVRKSLLGLPADAGRRIAASHGIPPDALWALECGDGDRFIRIRTEFLAERERRFMAQVGVTPSVDLMGEADIDTE